MIITGRQAIDGDTAQVGPQTAEHLDIPQVSYVCGLEVEKGGQALRVTRETEDGVQILEAQMPCLLTVLSSAVKPRYMSAPGIVEAYNKNVEIWSADKIDVDETKLGLNNMNKSDYKNVYVFAEQRGGVVQSVALELIGKARDLADALGEKVVAILAGYNVEPLIQTLFEYGADEVVVTDHPELKDYVTEEYAQAVSQIIDAVRPNIVLFGATTIGRDLAPRLSARLATGLTADCTKLEISEDKQLMMTRPAFGGNLMATIMCTEHRPQMSTVRPGV